MARIFFGALVLASLAATASAQVSALPDCTGHDPAAASTEFEAGNALLAQAIEQARAHHPERMPAMATEALSHFDRQCELGDTSAYAERGAALLMMQQPLASAQSYDRYLSFHPLDSLDARTRRRIEPNLQPGELDLEIQNARGRLFIDDLDFGALPRTTSVHVPFGEHRVEVRDADGTVLATETSSVTQDSTRTTVALFISALTLVPPPVEDTQHAAPPPPTPEPVQDRFDFLPFYIASGAVAAVGLGVGIGFIVAADERARTYNASCFPTLISGCDSVLSERDTDIGVAIAGFVLGGLGVAGLITTWILDANEPRQHLHVAFGPTSLMVSGEF